MIKSRTFFPVTDFVSFWMVERKKKFSLSYTDVYTDRNTCVYFFVGMGLLPREQNAKVVMLTSQ